ncbi:MAG: hypothetical protein KatS3mg053_2117 [Candidatus Roseilinea sp.]|nr:MAG: hypothetical protein KatS3mg053_2117 [Candidatus Roseilinea sp.]
MLFLRKVTINPNTRVSQAAAQPRNLFTCIYNEPSIGGNIWYKHWQWFNKAPGSITQGEVNYFFSYDPGNDLWLGKVNYNSAHNATSSDRSGLLNIY